DPSPVCDATRSDNRNREFIRQAWQQSKKADTLTLRSRLIKRASMAAGFVPLRYDGVGPGTLRLSCLSQSRCACKPGDSLILQLCDKWRGIQTHDRRNNGGPDGDKGVALLLKIRQPDSADLGWNCGPPA